VFTAGNVADDDTNKYIYYTLYKTHSFLLILLDLTLSALSLLSFSVSLAAFSRFPWRAPAANQLGLRPQAPPRSLDASSSGAAPISMTTSVVVTSNKCIAVGKVATPLRELTCHMGSHSVACHPAEVTFPPLPQPKLVLD